MASGGLLLGDAGPQLIHLALVYMQITKEIPHHILTMCPQDWQLMIPSISVDVQQPSGGLDTQAFRQGRCPEHVCGGIRADVRIRHAGTRRHQHGADRTAKTHGVPMLPPKLQLDVWRHMAIEGTLRILQEYVLSSIEREALQYWRLHHLSTRGQRTMGALPGASRSDA